MFGFSVVPEPGEHRRIRQLVTRTTTIWSLNWKESPQQQTLAFKQLSSLFNSSLVRLGRDLKPALDDLDLQPVKSTNDDSLIVNGAASRNSLFKQVAEKLIRAQLLRNQQIKRNIDDYSRDYECKHHQQSIATLEQEKPSSISELAPFHPRYARPRTTPINQRFCRSLVMERKEKSKEGKVLIVGESGANRPPLRSNTPVFQCRSLASGGKLHQQPTANTLNASKHLEMCSVQQITLPLPQNPEYPLLHLQQPEIPRVSFIDENRRQFAPAFGQRRHSAFSGIGTTYSKATEVEILKDKIRLLNCEFAIKVTRQNVYKKKQRNPRNLSSIIV